MEIIEKEIKQKVESRLQHDNRIKTGEIQVDVTGNNVKLEGSVSTIYAQQAAENDAYTVMGVKTVDNYLTIEPVETDAQPDDLEIEANIRQMLLWDNRIDTTEIEIVVDKGHVELNGSTYSYDEKKLAGDSAATIIGVRNVQNNIMVNTRHDNNDELLADRVFEALDANPYVNVNELDIAVNNGMVTLSGSLQSKIAANEAHDELLYIKGVRGISNRITIG